MSSTGKFVAQMLETSAAGYAGMTASRLLERHPEIVKRYEPDAFARWKAQLQRWLVDLSAALDAGASQLFETRMVWTRSQFDSRGVPTEDLRSALTALRDTLREKLPASSADVAVKLIDGALRAVDDPDRGRPEAAEPVEPAVLSYLRTILEGNPRAAMDRILETVDNEASARDAYLRVLIPAQRETGRMWHTGELSIAEEHLITATTQRIMALLGERGRASSTMDRTVLLACVSGNVHDIGIRAISDFFEMAGWRSINLGPDVPEEEIARGVTFFDADLVVLAATLDPHIKAMGRVIDRIRKIEDRDTKVIVGGPVFDEVPDLWRNVGADGHAARVEDAEPLGKKLLG